MKSQFWLRACRLFVALAAPVALTIGVAAFAQDVPAQGQGVPAQSQEEQIKTEQAAANAKGDARRLATRVTNAETWE